MNQAPPDPARIAAEVFGQNVDRARCYVDLLASKGVDYGLIGPREVPRLWERHVFNSVALIGLVADGVRAVDVGSGAGLPGIPVALARPDVEVTLLEPLLRRSDFLTEAIADLDLGKRVRVVRGRAEEHDERYDVVLARAVAPLDRLTGWCSPLLAPGGVMLLLKGARAEDEVRASQPELRRLKLDAEVLEVRAHPDTEPARVVRLTRR